jgi:hypothetical protein
VLITSKDMLRGDGPAAAACWNSCYGASMVTNDFVLLIDSLHASMFMCLGVYASGCRTHHYCLHCALQILAKRKGFVKIALQTGAKLVRSSNHSWYTLKLPLAVLLCSG